MSPPAPPLSPDQDSAILTIELEDDPPLDHYPRGAKRGGIQPFTGWMTGEGTKKHR